MILLSDNQEEKILQSQFGEAMVRVLSDNDLRAELVQRSRAAYDEFFSWPAIASRYCQFLREPN